MLKGVSGGFGVIAVSQLASTARILRGKEVLLYASRESYRKFSLSDDGKNQKSESEETKLEETIEILHDLGIKKFKLQYIFGKSDTDNSNSHH